MVESNTRIYLDYNASAPILPQAAQGVAHVLEMAGNPSSIHRDGRGVRALLDEARDAVGHFVNVPPTSITFTSGGTEANTTAVLGSLHAGLVSSVLCSASEHPSVLEHVDPMNRIHVKENGVVDLDHLEARLKTLDGPALVCVMFANNETGVLQPIQDVSELTHKYDGLVLCDSVQGPGKVGFDATLIGADFVTLSAHKIGGPPGVGALVNLCGAELRPVLVGGGQEKKQRSGTENSPGIVGFGAAAQAMVGEAFEEELSDMQKRFEAALQEAVPRVRIVGLESNRLPNTTCIVKEGVPADQQVIKLDLAGISVSAGSACSSGKVAESHVLKAMGLNKGVTKSAIRVSFGRETKWNELERFVEVWASL